MFKDETDLTDEETVRNKNQKLKHI